MGKIWLTSDLHFKHEKEFLWEPRGFSSVFEMNETIVKNINELVDVNDDLYILGDLCLGGGSDETLAANKKLIQSLKGNIHIILGNHDTDARINMYNQCYNVVEIVFATRIKYKGYIFYLSHYPTITSNFDQDKPLKTRVINLCGHSHTKDKFEEMNKGLLSYHVELDAHDNKPILLETALEDIKNYLREKGE